MSVDVYEKIQNERKRLVEVKKYEEGLEAFNKLMDEYAESRDADLSRLSNTEQAAAYMRGQKIANAFSKDDVEINTQACIDEWNRRAEMETENVERIYSLDMKYAAYISIHPNPIFQNEVIAGETEGCPIYRNGIGLTDRQSGTSRQLIAPGQDPIRENISNLIWSLESDIIYFTSYGDTAGSAGVYGCNIFSGKVRLLSDGNLVELILDEPYVGWLKILNSCFVEGESGRHWYYAALSPDGKTEIRLTEPSLDVPKN